MANSLHDSVRKTKKENDSDVATSINYVLLHLRVGISQYVIPKWASRELEGSQDYRLLSK